MIRYTNIDMPRYLVEVPHESTPGSCDRAVMLLLERGSHFVTNADLGCKDGIHMAWIVYEAESKDQVRNALPPIYRGQAKIIALQKFTLEDADLLKAEHKGKK